MVKDYSSYKTMTYEMLDLEHKNCMAILEETKKHIAKIKELKELKRSENENSI